jgi:hypothetical protein
MNVQRRGWRGVVGLALCLGLFAAGAARAQGARGGAEFRETPHFLVLLVHATGLDYQDQPKLVRSLHKSQMKGGFLGHAWVMLSGLEGGRREVVEAGLTPEDLESVQFFRGVLDLARYGYVNPTAEQKRNPRHEPDPISYLWQDLGNGFLRTGRQGGLQPTFAAKVDLDAEQYRRIKARLDPKLPSHRRFQVTGQQCSSFVAELARLAGVDLRHQMTLPVPREVEYGGRTVRLWSDSRYSSITFSSPDVIEADLRRLVASGRAVNALSWYHSAD